MVYDFDGKIVVVFSLGNIQDISLWYLFGENGLKDKVVGGSVIVVLIFLVDVVVVFVGKWVDVVLVFEFWGVVFEVQGYWVIGNEKIVWCGGNYFSVILIVNICFVQVNFDFVVVFLKVYVSVVVFLNKLFVVVQNVVNW